MNGYLLFTSITNVAVDFALIFSVPGSPPDNRAGRRAFNEGFLAFVRLGS